MKDQTLTHRFVQHRGVGKAAATVALYRLVANEFLEVANGHLEGPFTPQHIATYLKRICSVNAGSSVATKMTVLGVFIRWAAQQGLCDASVAEVCVAPKYPHPVPRTATPDEVSLLVRTAPLKLKTALLLASGLGLRESEIRGLTWRAIDLTPGVEQATVIGKGNKLRVLPIVDGVLLDHLREMSGSPRKSEYLVPGECGAMISRGVLGKRLTAHCGELAIRKLNMHSLRHFFASHSALSGVPTPTIQGMMGHSSLAVTSVYLTSLSSVENLRVGMQRMAAAG